MLNHNPQHLKSDQVLGEVPSNFGEMLLKNSSLYARQPAFAQREAGTYRHYSWQEFGDDLVNVAHFLIGQDFGVGERIAIIADNSYARLVSELAVMASGGVAVPIFQGYPADTLNQLLNFSEVHWLVIDDLDQLEKIETLPKRILILKGPDKNQKKYLKDNLFFLEDLLGQSPANKPQTQHLDLVQKRFEAVQPSDLALIMYTSGTSSFPKGVQLSHFNLLSQQKSLASLWDPQPGMRLLCYLPWHHSFGGLFERFFALYTGGCLAIDDSRGKDIDRLLENFREIKPHVYFSVPKIYQEIVAKVLKSKQAHEAFFHSDLKFIFTAAAPLPLSTSNIFKENAIPVVEGWGLTETSPCCTLTEISLDREPGVVGFPIAGVEIKLAQEDEILVRGPNVMQGYFKQSEATARVLDSEGWFRTGDVGEITPRGLKIISRKDRMFKLSNGEKVFPAALEENIKDHCPFVKHAYVFGKGQKSPCLLVFPNTELMGSEHANLKDCSCPEGLGDLSRCLGACLQELNKKWPIKFEKISQALIVDQEPSLERSELTPSFKLIPRKIEEHFLTYIQSLENGQFTGLPEDTFFVEAKKLSPSQPHLHYGIIGLGAVGSVLAAHLGQAGHRVSAISPNRRNLSFLEKKPLVVKGELNAQAKLTQLYLELDHFLSEDPDVVMICTKSVDSPELLKKIKCFYDHHRDKKPPVFVSCQNGLDVEDQIIETFGSSHTLRMVLNLGCNFTDDQEIQVNFAFTHVLSQRADVDPLINQAIADQLTHAGFPTDLKEGYRTEVFLKAILNASLGTVCALTGMTMQSVMKEPNLSRMVKQIVREGIAVGQAMGLAIPSDFLDEAMTYLRAGGQHKPSILIDVERQRKTENDYHCGKIFHYAEKYGINVDVTQTLYYLTNILDQKQKAK